MILTINVNDVLGALLIPLGVIAFSVFIAWLTVRLE